MTEERSFLVLGGDSSIGAALVSRLRSEGESVIVTSRRREACSDDVVFFDLQSSRWDDPRPVSVAYLCAAVTSLEACRTDPVGTFAVNVLNTKTLAKNLEDRGAFIVFLSTNLVYDGSTPATTGESRTSPLTEYGRQKDAVEKVLLASGGGACVVRITKVLTPDNQLFNGWIKTLREGRTIHPFSDLFMAPVSLNFVVEALRRIGKLCPSGVVQISGTEDISYADAALYLARRLGVSQDLVQPGTAENAGMSLDFRPAHTTLDSNRLRLELQMEPPSAWETLNEVFGF